MDPRNPLNVQWSSDQTAALQLLRDWAVAFTDLNRHLAAWMDLPGTDATALGHIIWAAQEERPLTPLDLSRHLGMTTGATTALLNRLEAAGHVARSREQTDRRRVTIRPLPSTMEQAAAFFDVAGVEVAEVVLGTSSDDLRRITAFLARIGTATVSANDRLQQQKGHWTAEGTESPAGAQIE